MVEHTMDVSSWLRKQLVEASAGDGPGLRGGVDERGG